MLVWAPHPDPVIDARSKLLLSFELHILCCNDYLCCSFRNNVKIVLSTDIGEAMIWLTIQVLKTQLYTRTENSFLGVV